VRTLEILGVSLSLLYFWKLPHFGVNAGLFVFLFASYLFLRLCDAVPWAETSRAIGIRVHFQKALVPTSYILTVTAFAAILDAPILSMATIALADLMMIAIVSVNGILIYFHRRDQDPLPRNYFSSNQYKADEALENREDIQKLQASPY